jgi:hypothetical protein
LENPEGVFMIVPQVIYDLEGLFYFGALGKRMN